MTAEQNTRPGAQRPFFDAAHVGRGAADPSGGADTTGDGSRVGATALYRHFNAEGELLYVGIAANPTHRLERHRERSHWFREISRIDVEWFDTRELALAAERAAIQAEDPPFNIRHRRQGDEFVHVLRDGLVHQQATVKRRMRNGALVLQLYSWLTGEPTEVLLARAGSHDLRFYASEAAWLDAGRAALDSYDVPAEFAQLGANK